MKFSMHKLLAILLLSSSYNLFSLTITHNMAVHLATIAHPQTDATHENTHHDRRQQIVEAIQDQELNNIVWDDILESDAEKALVNGHFAELEAFVKDTIGNEKIAQASADSGMGKGAIVLVIGFLFAYVAQNREKIAELARLADEDPKAFAEFVWGQATGLAGLGKEVIMAVVDLSLSDLKPSTYTSFTENPIGNTLKLVASTVALVGGAYATKKACCKVKHRHDDEGKSWWQASYLTDNVLIGEEGVVYKTKNS